MLAAWRDGNGLEFDGRQLADAVSFMEGIGAADLILSIVRVRPGRQCQEV
jgi:hypothetical protein